MNRAVDAVAEEPDIEEALVQLSAPRAVPASA